MGGKSGGLRAIHKVATPGLGTKQLSEQTGCLPAENPI